MQHAAAIVLVLAAVVSCMLPVGPESSPPPPPSEAAAIAYLAEVVAVVRSRDLDRLCEFGGGACRRELEFGLPTIPRTAPRLVGSVEVPSTVNDDGSWNVGGRLLRLCGVDGLGSPYYSEILVFTDAGRLIGREPVFWTGTTIDTMPAIARPEAPKRCPLT